MKKYLAIDIGASSGRHIIGWKEDGELKTARISVLYICTAILGIYGYVQNTVKFR